MIPITVDEALVKLQSVSERYRSRNKEDFALWVDGGKALHDLRAAHKTEKKRRLTKDEMRAYCEPYGFDVSTAYRWMKIAKFEPQLRKKMDELKAESAEQYKLLSWVKELTPRKTRKQAEQTKKDGDALPKPCCPNCLQMAAEIARLKDEPTSVPKSPLIVVDKQELDAAELQTFTLRVTLALLVPIEELGRETSAVEIKDANGEMVASGTLDEVVDWLQPVAAKPVYISLVRKSSEPDKNAFFEE